MKTPITIKQIEEKAKVLKLSPAGYWIGKSSKIDLNDKHGLCVLYYAKESCFLNMKPYEQHAGIIFSEIAGKPITVKAIHVGIKDNSCKPS